MVLRVLLMALGAWACSTSVIFIKTSGVYPVLLAGYRLMVAALILAPFFLRDMRQHRARYSLRHVGRTLLPGVFLAAHLSSWTFGARLTPAANACLIVNTMPIVMPFILYFMVRETINRGELLGTVLAIVGIVLLGASDLTVQSQYALGDVVCFGSMTMLACYMALARRNRDFASIWLYVVPLYFFASLVCLALGLTIVLFGGAPLALASRQEIWLILGLGLVPTVIGHSIINYSMKYFRGQVVSIAGLSEFIFGGTMAFFLLGEVPRWRFYPASLLIVGGVILVLWTTPAAALRAEAPEISLPG